MTPRQNDCLRAIRDLTVDGVAPTIQELADRLGIAKSRAWYMVEGLITRGYVHRNRAVDRGLSLIDLNGVSDEAIAAMTDDELKSAYARIGAALERRRVAA